MTPGVPQTEEYANYANAHIHELLDKYKPCILWNDMGYPRSNKEHYLYNSFAKLFNKICPGASLTNNRWGLHDTLQKHRFEGDFKTPEYTKLDVVTENHWEMNRGLGFSFGYNRIEGANETMTTGELSRLLIDVVSKNGNMLLDVGPLPDGSFSSIQELRLREFAVWCMDYMKLIHFSRPFLPVGSKPEGNFRYLRSKDDSKVVIFVMEPTSLEVMIPMSVNGSFHAAVVLPGEIKQVESKTIADGVKFSLPRWDQKNDWPIAIVLYGFTGKSQDIFKVQL